MDLELTDEQRWLSESVDTLLSREWPPPEGVAEATDAQRRRVWAELLGFGALSVGDGIGAIEGCLIAGTLGRHLASTPFVASAAVALASPVADPRTVALALAEPGGGWSVEALSTELRRSGEGVLLSGEKVGVEHLDLAETLAVVGDLAGERVLALIPADAPGLTASSRPSFDATLPTSAVFLDDVVPSSVIAGSAAVERLQTAGALLAAAEAVGAAMAVLDAACRYAAERRQFGRRITAFQALRHLLAGLHVRAASGWSSVLYAAAAFDDDAEDAAESASVAKAYASRASREVAQGAMQVFGGIAFTDEHPAHRFLRRILVREQQFGNASHHERALGRKLAETAAPAAASLP